MLEAWTSDNTTPDHRWIVPSEAGAHSATDVAGEPGFSSATLQEVGSELTQLLADPGRATIGTFATLVERLMAELMVVRPLIEGDEASGAGGVWQSSFDLSALLEGPCERCPPTAAEVGDLANLLSSLGNSSDQEVRSLRQGYRN